ncbi:MAG: signal recognition particle protein [Solitalea-like symbiont of Tyrophagus putrescentiae]
MFESLSDRLEKAFKILKGNGKITEINVAETTKEIRKALIDADVSYKLAKEITDTVRNKALGMKVLDSVSPGQLLTKIVNDELIDLMGGSEADIDVSLKPSIILMVGLNGSGKTTTSAKIAKYIKDKRNKKILLIAADTFRPAAVDQLKMLGAEISVEVFSIDGEKDPIKVSIEGVKYGKQNSFDTIIIDTAGRLSINEKLMDEIINIQKEVSPHETIFVADAMTGQDAVNTAKSFDEKLNITGVVLTKMDSDTRGGAALSISAVVKKPVKFIGISEKVSGLEIFKPKQIAGRILGKGDIVAFVERIQEHFDKEESLKLQKKLRENKFDFDDLLKQIEQIRKMGNLKDLVSMIPGVGKQVKDLDVSTDMFKQMEIIIYSMTSYERQNPKDIDLSRKSRIAKGAGVQLEDVNKFLKQFGEMSKLMKNGSSLKGRLLHQMRGYRAK